MSSKAAIAWILLFVALTVIGTSTLRNNSDDGADTLVGTVTRVVDGDTVKVRLDNGEITTVRYIGVDTPETVKPDEPVQCFGKAASSYNKQLVEAKAVRLRIGRERLDRYHRLLAYVYLRSSGAFVNELLIARGYARTLAIAPNTAFAARFARLQRQARRNGVGLWRACPAGG